MTPLPECKVKAVGSHVTGTITAYFEDPALYAAYKQGQEDLANFLIALIEAKDEEITCARCKD